MRTFRILERIKNFLDRKADVASKEMMPIGWGRDTFFDEGVQKVLLERHPENYQYDSTANHYYPIEAWKVADQQALGTRLHDETELRASELAFNDREWFARLTLAVSGARSQRAERERNPQNDLDRFLNWRNQHFLFDARPPSKYDEALTAMGSKVGKDPTGSIRKAMSLENRRRKQIWDKWGQCWMTHLHGYPTEGTADLADKLVKKSSVTKSS